MFTQFFEPETAEKRNRRQGLDKPGYNSVPRDRLLLFAGASALLALILLVTFVARSWMEFRSADTFDNPVLSEQTAIENLSGTTKFS